jgi:glycolate oxidase iron-sulfur subunit
VQTRLAERFKHTAYGQEAEKIIGNCVHCGFCNATCPTYQLLGDELDGPRGRIYLIKQVLEGQPATERTQQHLDRCLTCRNCETTCPSGVQYGHLIDIGRMLVERGVPRRTSDRSLRAALREGLTGSWFAPTLKLGQAFRNWLPQPIRSSVPEPLDAGPWPTRRHQRRMLLMPGCVQPSLRPTINAATARVLDAAGIEVQIASGGCCGAIRQHLADPQGALREARANIDSWWPAIESGESELLLTNASGCAAMVLEYGHLLGDDPLYADRARKLSEATRDVSQVLAGCLPDLADRLKPAASPQRVAFHPPCTLQNALKLSGATEQLLTSLGARLVPFEEAHLCCGSAGTYSVLQPQLARALRDRKLERIKAAEPDAILSSNIGCIQHLQTGTALPVMHWIEWLDRRLAPQINQPNELGFG